ncbi:membrane protein [Mycobacterium antarcticum]|uniref:DUF881 domain-containing protein n=1 Tax=unclassified Mycolicibacterium TaxID=2636767 RepID=UPI00238CB0E0|nr:MULTISPECIES: DUF881 domain-containing protein [unclassified Mycolicibacterium]BDX29468.1 membrane protein [Mycolicibacterium sp. TUM20985]GLP72905.1 membrane protein [Mycolicibacterium sp. TUM20983]
MARSGRSPWRFGVPVVCVCAGLLLATTHTVSGGNEIRRSDSPRLVDLVREAQGSVDRLADQREVLVGQVDNHHGGTPNVDAALKAITDRADVLAVDAGLAAMRGPGLVVTLDDAHRDAEGRFPGDASADDLVVHQQDIEAVLNALWSAGAEAIQMQDQRIIATSAPLCVGNTLLLNGRTYSPPYAITAIGDVTAMQSALAASQMVDLYKRYVLRFGLGYTEEAKSQVDVVAHPPAVRMRYAKPAGPLGY